MTGAAFSAARIKAVLAEIPRSIAVGIGVVVVLFPGFLLLRSISTEDAQITGLPTYSIAPTATTTPLSARRADPQFLLKLGAQFQ
jgi:hypothetical protein